MDAKEKAACNGSSGQSHAGVILVFLFTVVLPLLSGCVVRDRHTIPPPPLMYGCVASPGSVFAGDPVTVAGTPSNFDPARPAKYAWTTSGGKVSGNRSVATVDTTGLKPGSYEVKGTASEGQTVGQSASCSAPFTVNASPPLAVSCSASPSAVSPGSTSTITALAQDPAGRSASFSYSYAASAGFIAGTGPTATLSTAGGSSGVTTITCSVLDTLGRRATASTEVQVLAPVAAPPPRSSSALYSCKVSQERVRAGDPVEVTLSPQPPAGAMAPVIRVDSSAGVLDVGRGFAVLDTFGLAPGRVNVSGPILLGEQVVGMCDTAVIIDPRAPVAPWRIDLMRVGLLPGQKESPGFAVYTYLLYRKQPTSDEQKKRLKSIFAEIAAQNSSDLSEQPVVENAAPGPPLPAAAAGSQGKLSRRNLAPIVVPVQMPGDFTEDWLLAHYDIQHAALLLRNVQCEKSNTPAKCSRTISGDGPFLISSTIRLSARPHSLLVQDLGGLSPDIAGQWVGAFMHMVTQKRNWTQDYTADKIKLDASVYLDRAGGVLTQSHDAVLAAMKLLKWGN